MATQELRITRIRAKTTTVKPVIAASLLLAMLGGPWLSVRAGDIRTTPARGPAQGRAYGDYPGVQTVRIYRNFLVVAEGQIDGISGPQNFILDTGSAPSIVNARIADQLGLTTTAAGTAALGQRVPLQASTVPALELGPIRAASLPVLVKDLSRLEHDCGIPIAGIIGLDVLSRTSFRLDYEAKELEFGAVLQEGIPVPFDPHTGTAVAEGRVDGRLVRMLVDTGSESLVILGGNFAGAGWPELRNASQSSQSGTSIADKNLQLQILSSPKIVLGGRHFTTGHAYVVPGSVDPGFDALLGVRALGFRALSYDRASRTIFLGK